MKSLSVIELSNLYGMTRQAVYKQINKGNLSKNSDGKIDLSEAIRVFGEPIRKQDVKETVKVDSPNSAEVLLLRQQIVILKNQLDDAKDRESFYQNQIETMQRLLEAPKPHIPTSVDPDPTQAEPMTEEKEEVIAMPQKEPDATENKRIPVPEQVEPEQPKRGWLSRFFLPNG